MRKIFSGLTSIFTDRIPSEENLFEVGTADNMINVFNKAISTLKTNPSEVKITLTGYKMDINLFKKGNTCYANILVKGNDVSLTSKISQITQNLISACGSNGMQLSIPENTNDSQLPFNFSAEGEDSFEN